MKRCPECRRDYYDDSLFYCLEDGTVLVQGSVAPSLEPAANHPHVTTEPATLSIRMTEPADAAPTQMFARPPQQAGPNSIVVLPFANLSRDEDAEYLSDGLAEELLNVLTKIEGLRVIGRSSAFSFKGKQTTIAEIGRQLHVSSVLEGSVRMAGKRVRISVQLVNVADESHLWSETYDRTFDDIFAIQDDIARSVVEELRSRFTGSKEPDSGFTKQIAVEVAGAVKDRTDNPEVQRLMLLGRHLFRRRTKADMAKALECYERALEIDADNAQCWLGLALVQASRTGFGYTESYDEGFRAARTAVKAALRIEPDLAAAQILLARLKLMQDRDFRGADESMQRARELGVDDIDLIEMGSATLRILGQFDEVIGTGQKVLAVDPLNIAALSSISHAGYPAGKLDEAERAARRALEIAPQAVHRRAILALILAENGRFEEARIEAAKETDPVWGPWATALVEIAAGRLDKARDEMEPLIREYREEAAFQIAEVYSKMGESDKAFEFLDIAVDTDPGISEILVSLQLRALHTDPRLEPLLRKIGIPEEYWPKR